MATYPSTSLFDAITYAQIPNGNHTFTINGVILGTDGMTVNNFYGNTTVASGTSQSALDSTYFTGASATKTMVLIFHGNLTIGQNIMFRPTTSVRGLVIYVKGNLTLDSGATINMSARGNSSAPYAINLAVLSGQNQIVPAAGGALGSARVATKTSSTGNNVSEQGLAGSAGSTVSNRATGGGGSGGAVVTSSTNNISATSGAGTAGTTWSGGAGGGAITSGATSNQSATNASGIAGGAGFAARSTGTAQARSAGGGAGSLAGSGSTTAGSATLGTSDATHSGQLGTGGLIVLYVLGSISGSGTMLRSEGSAGGGTGLEATGGSSGGGSVNVFYGGTIPANFVNSGISVVGGTSPTAVDVRGAGVSATGGAGGTGSKNADPLGTANLPKRILLSSGSSLYYYDFNAASNNWKQATGTGNEPFTTYGMLEGELYALTSAQIATLPLYNSSSIKVRVYTP